MLLLIIAHGPLTLCHIVDLAVLRHTRVLNVLFKTEWLVCGELVLPVGINIAAIWCTRDLVPSLHGRGQASIQVGWVRVSDPRKTEWIVARACSERRDRPPVIRDITLVKLFLILLFDLFCDRDCLSHRFVICQEELRGEPFFSSEDTFDLQSIKQLCFVNMVHVFLIIVQILDILLIVFFFLFLNVALLLQVFRWVTVCAVFAVRDICAAKLIVDILNLALHLLIRAFHQVKENIHHTKSIGLLLQALPREDRVERAVNMGAHLQIVMLHHIREDLEDVDLRCKLLTFVFTAISKRKIHQKGRRIFH